MLADELRRMLTGRGAAWVGYADLESLPADARMRMPRGVSVAVALDSRIVGRLDGGPTVEYCAEYKRVNSLLNTLTAAAAGFLTERGFRAMATPATLSKPDPLTLWTALPHKTVATRAGMGWVGKCALLVSESFGSATRIASVLTDAPLPPGVPQDESRCGECRACVEACPAKAPSGRTWTAGLNRADFFNVFACRDMCREMAAKRSLPSSICGLCVAACPWTQKYLRRANA